MADSRGLSRTTPSLWLNVPSLHQQASPPLKLACAKNRCVLDSCCKPYHTSAGAECPKVDDQ